jgi:hypothetical protein
LWRFYTSETILFFEQHHSESFRTWHILTQIDPDPDSVHWCFCLVWSPSELRTSWKSTSHWHFMGDSTGSGLKPPVDVVVSKRPAAVGETLQPEAISPQAG